MPMYRGVCTTDDPDNPTIATAAGFDNRRSACRAAMRAAKAAGYRVTREQCHAEAEDEEDDEEELDSADDLVDVEEVEDGDDE